MKLNELRRRQHFSVPALDGKRGQVLDLSEGGVTVRWKEWREPRTFQRKGKWVTIKGGWKWSSPSWIYSGLEVTVNGAGRSRPEV